MSSPSCIQTQHLQDAAANPPLKPSWPVHNDHCFARIILDKTIGVDAPWTTKIKSPAYKNMSREQLTACIELGQKILDGEVNLVELDDESLAIRGKSKAKGVKRRTNIERSEDGGIENREETIPKKRRISPATNSSLPQINDIISTSSSASPPPPTPPAISTPPMTLRTLSTLPAHTPPLTPFRHLVLTTLLQVPAGSYTTYGLLATHLNSSPRAVGNALRNNPFAPQVPCHRVLASGGGLGGFKGSWGRGQEGMFDEEKRKLLRAEGVRFDGRGRVVGAPWRGLE